MVIDTEFGMKNHNLIPATVIGRRQEPLDARTDPSNYFKLGIKVKNK
jgi:hypothetical protein